MRNAKRTRMDVVFYTPKGSRIQWKTAERASHTPEQIVRQLRQIADSIEKIVAPDDEAKD